MSVLKRIAALGVLAVVVFSVGCSRKPAQPYVAIGTLEMTSDFAGPVERMLAQGANAEVIMTVRTSPSAEDVIVQRRWANATFPFSFGLGKNLGQSYREKYAGKKIYLTAQVTIRSRQGGVAATLVGWTRQPVDIGTYYVKLMIDRQIEYLHPDQEENLPSGGWSSSSVVEEAMPPGMTGGNPGPRVFSGSVDVPLEMRSAFTRFKLFMVARGFADHGAPQLVVPYENPVFPVRFALHENHVVAGMPKKITETLFVVAILDEDGSLDTKNDQFVVATPEAVAPESFDLRLAFTMSKDDVAKKEMVMPKGGPTPNGAAGTAGAATSPGEKIVVGTVIVPEELKAHLLPSSVLYVSIRSKDDQLILSKRLPPALRTDFALTPNDSLNGQPVTTVPAEFTVKATIAGSGDVLSPTPDDLEMIVRDVKKGQAGVELVLGLKKK